MAVKLTIFQRFLAHSDHCEFLADFLTLVQILVCKTAIQTFLTILTFCLSGPQQFENMPMYVRIRNLFSFLSLFYLFVRFLVILFSFISLICDWVRREKWRKEEMREGKEGRETLLRKTPFPPSSSPTQNKKRRRERAQIWESTSYNENKMRKEPKNDAMCGRKKWLIDLSIDWLIYRTP